MHLFQSGAFELRGGESSAWKIECDALTAADWGTLASIAVTHLPRFHEVRGVPRGGLPFAAALAKHVTPGSDCLLIAEDVCTTGGSMTRYRATVESAAGASRIVGVCAFARGRPPEWVTPLFRTPEDDKPCLGKL